MPVRAPAATTLTARRELPAPRGDRWYAQRAVPPRNDRELLSNPNEAALALAEAILAYDQRRPTPDRDREARAIDAMADAESIDEAWERMIARSILPEPWIDSAHRRFYAVSQRCARCGHPERCRLATCADDERREPVYEIGPRPGCLWDLLVIAGHVQRIIDAEAQGEERQRTIRSERHAHSRTGWTFEIARPDRFLTSGLSSVHQPIVQRALAIADERAGRPMEKCVPLTQHAIVAWLQAFSARERRASAEPYAPHVLFLGQHYGWSSICLDLAPTLELAQRLPRALPLTR